MYASSGRNVSLRFVLDEGGVCHGLCPSRRRITSNATNLGEGTRTATLTWMALPLVEMAVKVPAIGEVKWGMGKRVGWVGKVATT